MEADILFQEYTTESNYIIAEISLNNDKKLNALNFSHIKSITEHLKKWEEQNEVVAIFIHSNSNKSFCAGGDIRELYYSVLEEDSNGPINYFTHEYHLHYLIHTYSKPIICWANGITMGGGLGIMSACNFRIVNDNSSIAMPEVNIGFYPDSGAAFFLGRLPKNIGLFIALTGCRLNAADAIYIGLADAFIDNEFKDRFISNLKKTNWKSVDANHQILRLIKDLSLNSCGWEPYSKLRKYRDLISGIVNQPSLDAIIAAIEAVDTNDPWLLDAKQRILISSPLSQLITYNFFHDSKKLSLKEVLQCEIELSTKIVWEGDFFEGVRSLLIKKDGNPSWKNNSIQGIDLKTYYNNPAKKFLNWEFP